ncbi:MAG: hypothetical protein ACYC0M_15365 [Burkholderiales bacterium]
MFTFLKPYMWIIEGVVMLGLVGGLFAGGWYEGDKHVQAAWDAAKAQQAASIAQVKAAQAKVSAQVVIKYIDRVRTIRVRGATIIKEVPKYVTQADNSKCSVNNGSVIVLNAASTNTVPPPPSRADDAPSALTLSDLTSVVAANYERCSENASKLTALQGWVREQETASP